MRGEPDRSITHCELDSQDPRKTEAGELESFKELYLYYPKAMYMLCRRGNTGAWPQRG